MPPGKSPLVPTGHVVPTKVTQRSVVFPSLLILLDAHLAFAFRHAYSQPSSTRSPSPQHHNSPLTSPVPCRTSPWPHASREPLDLSMEEWLKKIRLHKYSSVLSKYNLAQVSFSLPFPLFPIFSTQLCVCLTALSVDGQRPGRCRADAGCSAQAAL